MSNSVISSFWKIIEPAVKNEVKNSVDRQWCLCRSTPFFVLVDPHHFNAVKGCGSTKTKKVWIDQDIIDSPHCSILMTHKFFFEISRLVIKIVWVFWLKHLFRELLYHKKLSFVSTSYKISKKTSCLMQTEDLEVTEGFKQSTVYDVYIMPNQNVS